MRETSRAARQSRCCTWSRAPRRRSRARGRRARWWTRGSARAPPPRSSGRSAHEWDRRRGAERSWAELLSESDRSCRNLRRVIARRGGGDWGLMIEERADWREEIRKRLSRRQRQCAAMQRNVISKCTRTEGARSCSRDGMDGVEEGIWILSRKRRAGSGRE